jgi:DNA invertase Pin-like site-specific DNA recombinase
MEIGYAPVSTAKQDLARQQDDLAATGVTTVFADKKSGATTDRVGLREALRHARAGDVLVVHTLTAWAGQFGTHLTWSTN